MKILAAAVIALAIGVLAFFGIGAVAQRTKEASRVAYTPGMIRLNDGTLFQCTNMWFAGTTIACRYGDGEYFNAPLVVVKEWKFTRP